MKETIEYGSHAGMVVRMKNYSMESLQRTEQIIAQLFLSEDKEGNTIL